VRLLLLGILLPPLALFQIALILARGSFVNAALVAAAHGAASLAAALLGVIAACDDSPVQRSST
jgi:hypothetical protein